MLDFLKSLSIERLLPTALTAVVGVLAIRSLVKLLTRALEKSRLEKAAHSLVLSVARVCLYLLLALILASGLGVDVTSLVALASVVSLAVSLSVQDILTNIFGGFTLLSTHPFKAGDYVEVAGQAGTVNEVGIAYTKLTTPDNKLISIPNSAVVGAEIVNYTVTGTRRLDLQISASYDSPISGVLQALLQAGDCPGVLAEPAPFAGVWEYGDSAIVYKLQLWTPTDQYWPIRYEVNRRIQEEFQKAGLEMTYPHLNVHLDS